ncbi:LLM class flavin-dependent oxidoreductase [Burkholderia pseudomultivorans]|uniref:LLM class flavin-dependent oxidoreductase n=1 Tax=Burkholderia pseudomultivorans TaxID=1207504 RepID=UPI00075C76F7|nr:LLM class flavin-dependent oxidoreductase [Burkholderia pseudomultivorans]KWF05384.1 oxidoreductase [Burkholderia pseudomultivorans]KWI47413.1 oxidoreductase [Burkholderia pseudomultivorans]
MTLAADGVRITRISFLTPGNYAADDPLPGLEQTLDLFRIGEALGYDSAWVRQRHLERAVSSAATFLAAASQHTTRIGLGAAVIQMGYENPFRLAEDLATVDILSRGRLNVGLSAGAPPHGALLGDRLFDAAPEQIDFSHARVARLRANLTGEPLGDEHSFVESPAGRERPRVMPYAPGLTQRLWYGGGSLRSVEWAGRHGFHLLIGNLNRGECTDDFFVAQRSHIATYRANWRGAQPPRIALGRVIVPTDSADRASVRRYRAFAAQRFERTLGPQGPKRTLYAPDLVGSAAEIVERLLADPIVRLTGELRLELPYDFAADEYVQILTDFVQYVAPHLGWRIGEAVAVA